MNGNAQIAEVLDQLSTSISHYLNENLPTLAHDNWWQEHVYNVLSYKQQQYIDNKHITKLAQLDLAALLRILKENIYDISWKTEVPAGASHNIKKMLDLRHRWAHKAANETFEENLKNDISTMLRTAEIINAPESVLMKIREIGSQVDDKFESPPQEVVVATPPQSPVEDMAYSKTQMVMLRSDNNKYGPIIDIHELSPENRYSVFIDNEIKTYYESQIEPFQDAHQGILHITTDDFNAHLSAIQISNPGLTDLFSLSAARVDFVPYQFRPVLKFLKNDRPRLLIADSVGVGKTIEAGLIMKELQARHDINSILIICPKPLVAERKWQLEMKRFDERFTQLDGKTLRHCIEETDLEGEWPDQHKKTILPFSLFDEVSLYGDQGEKRKTKRAKSGGLLSLDPPPHFDLVIVDEAHHIRNPQTYTHDGVRYFCDNAEAVLFLTATPIQLGDQDLFVLLNALRPDLVIDSDSFRNMVEPNKLFNSAIEIARKKEGGWNQDAAGHLSNVAKTDWGRKFISNDPNFTNIIDSLQADNIPDMDRIRLINKIENHKTFSNLINRTRRRDIGEFTIRQPNTIEVEFTPSQQHLHDKLLDVQATILSHLHQNVNIKFMMTTLRRQTASCIFGLAPSIEDILGNRLSEFDVDEDGDSISIPGEQLQQLRNDIYELVIISKSLPKEDPKYEALRSVINDKQEMANNKVMLFSTFRHTLKYLYEKLLSEGLRVGLIHGAVGDEERVEIRNRFSSDKTEPNSIDVLLLSEVGCEGLDYQFCDCLVNYDLPWNPMKVEQRIGRIDRRGQKSEKVLIYNLVTPGTVDADIYDRCLLRIGVFNSTLGGSEEILGKIAKEIRSIADNFSLTAGERQEKLQQLADNEVREVEEQRRLEEESAELFGVRVPVEQLQEDIEKATNHWLSQDSIQGLINRYFARTIGDMKEYVIGEKSNKSLRLQQSDRKILLNDYKNLPRMPTTSHRQWEVFLKGNQAYFPLTFDTRDAINDPNIAFITPMHPLVKQASKCLLPNQLIFSSFSVLTDLVSAGRIPFAIYEWQYSGIRKELALVPVCEEEDTENKIFELLEIGRQSQLPADQVISEQEIEKLESMHYQKWTSAKEEHKKYVEKMVGFRRESLDTSHTARMSIIEDKLNKATHENIIRMTSAQKSNAQNDYERMIAEMSKSISENDIATKAVAYGVMLIENYDE
jgi:ATP-dependent helicase HepA